MSNWRPPVVARYDDIKGVSSNTGTWVTSGSANTKGATVSLGSAAFDWDGFFLTAGAGNGWNTILDLSLDSGASDLLVSNYYLPNSSSLSQIWGTTWFPVPVKSGATVYCRTGSGTAAIVTTVSLVGCKGSIGYQQRFSRAVGLGNDLSSTVAPEIANGGSGTWGTFQQIVASTADHYAALMVAFDNDQVNTGVNQDITVTLGIGASGSEKTLAIVRGGRLPAYFAFPSAPQLLFVDVPSGSRLSAKAQAATTSSGNDLALSILGLVA